MEILVTGGTGNLGRLVVDRLRAAGNSVRVLSRSSRPGVVTGDLVRNVGLGPAVAGADVLVHCATGRNDARATANLLSAAQAAGSPHVVYISIVGVDRIPFFLYRQKLRSETLIANSGLPFTILRATQFHTLVASIFDAQRRLPVLFVPSVMVQSVDVSDVADALAALATGAAAGRVADLGGPERRPAGAAATEWQKAERHQRRQVTFRVPGGMFRALRAGLNTTPGTRTGSVLFADFLAARSR
ncbi:NAD(P)H-binding protein [Mycetocola sp. 2940]|uniref:SDR family oxidoreductase n=1 Tax=Mycetocola sp. 2940 TaxID=3156452 RepID=UPI003395AFEB